MSSGKKRLPSKADNGSNHNAVLKCLPPNSISLLLVWLLGNLWMVCPTPSATLLARLLNILQLEDRTKGVWVFC